MVDASPSLADIAAVRGSTEVLLVVADPVAQVKAPEAFNLVFARCGVDAIVVPALVNAQSLRAFVDGVLAAGNVRGLLVSIPHKTALAEWLPQVDAVGRAAGAVNAVRRRADGTPEGALFDGAGFMGALRHHGVACQGRRALLVGCGGAGLAIACALAGAGLAELVAFDAQRTRAEVLVERIAPLSAHPVRRADSADPAGFDLVIQATPMGLSPADPLPLDPSRVEPHATVMDILMTREPTPLQAACRARGIAAHRGHEMLIQQMPAYLDYFGFGEVARTLRDDRPDLMQALRTTFHGADANP
jgi:shikimate dehydrogenase